MAGRRMFPQIIHTWMYGTIEFNDILISLRNIGADGADLSVAYCGKNSPGELLDKNILSILQNNGLKVFTVTGMYMQPELDLSSNDPKICQTAIDFSKQCVDVAVHSGCDRMLVSPSWVSVRHHPNVNYEEDWKRAVFSLQTVAYYAERQNITLLIEPINRYRVFLVHTVEEALRMKNDIGAPNVGIVPDTFHMNIEEKVGVSEAIRSCGKNIMCLHIGDQGRTVPGYGCMDWQTILRTLYEIDFCGALSFEPVFLYFNENLMSIDKEYKFKVEEQFRFGISYLRKIMESF